MYVKTMPRTLSRRDLWGWFHVVYGTAFLVSSLDCECDWKKSLWTSAMVTRERRMAGTGSDTDGTTARILKNLKINTVILFFMVFVMTSGRSRRNSVSDEVMIRFDLI